MKTVTELLRRNINDFNTMADDIMVIFTFYLYILRTKHHTHNIAEYSLKSVLYFKIYRVLIVRIIQGVWQMDRHFFLAVWEIHFTC